MWYMGPARYQTLARLYAGKGPDPSHRGVDINVVARRTTVFPTSQQTGMELLRMFNYAAAGFSRVTLYIEHSVFREDFPLIARAMTQPLKTEIQGDTLTVSAVEPLLVNIGEIPMVTVDGRPSPFVYGGEVFIPAGTHDIRPFDGRSTISRLRVNRLNGTPLAGEVTSEGLHFTYSSDTRAIAVLNANPALIAVDGRPYPASNLMEGYGEFALALPPGSHQVVLKDSGGKGASQPPRPSR